MNLDPAILHGLDDLFVELHEYLDQRADAEYLPGRPSPVGNREMMLLVELDDLHHYIKKGLSHESP